MKPIVITTVFAVCLCVSVARPAQARTDAVDVLFDVVEVDYVEMSTGKRVGYGLLGVALAVVGGTIGAIAIVASAPVWLTAGALVTGAALVGAGARLGLKGALGREMVVDHNTGDNLMRYRDDPQFIPVGATDPFGGSGFSPGHPEPQDGFSRI